MQQGLLLVMHALGRVRLSLLLVVTVITRSVRNKAYCVLSISSTSKTVCDEYSSEIHHYQVNSTTAVNYNHTVLGKAQTDSDSTTRFDMDSENGFHIDQATRRRVYADVYCRKIHHEIV